MTAVDRRAVLEKYGGRCAYCGRTLTAGRKGDTAFQVDHVHARYLGGTDDPDNLVPACRLCNRYKVTYTPEEFRQQLMLIPGRLAAKNMTFRLAQRHGLIIVADIQPTFLIDGEKA